MKNVLLTVLILIIIKVTYAQENQFKVYLDNYGDISAIYSIEEKSLGNDNNCCYFEGVNGILKKIYYEDDEMTISGIVIEETLGQRTFINIDGKILRVKMLRVDYGNLYTLFYIDSPLSIDVNSCGSGPVLSAVNIKKSQ
jgi:hypothetical protein